MSIKIDCHSIKTSPLISVIYKLLALLNKVSLLSIGTDLRAP